MPGRRAALVYGPIGYPETFQWQSNVFSQNDKPNKGRTTSLRLADAMAHKEARRRSVFRRNEDKDQPRLDPVALGDGATT